MDRRRFLAALGLTPAVPAALQAAAAAPAPPATATPPGFRWTPTQAAFLNHPARVRVFAGDRGTGKTTAGAFDLVTRATPGSVNLFVAPVSEMGKGMFRALRDWGLRTQTVILSSAPYMTLTLANRAELHFVSGQALAAGRWHGFRADRVWLDEPGYLVGDAWAALYPCLHADTAVTLTVGPPPHPEWLGRFLRPNSGSPGVAWFVPPAAPPVNA